MSTPEHPVSPDGRHRWDGTNWVPIESTVPVYPPPPPSMPVAGGYPVLPRRKQPIWLWIVIASVVGVCGLCGLGGIVAGLSEGDEPSSSASSRSEADEESKTDAESQGDDSEASDEASEPETSEPQPEPPPSLSEMPALTASELGGTVGKEMQLPKDQREFFKIVGRAQAVGEDANEFAVVQARKDRGRAICDLLGSSLRVSRWVGVVDLAETTLGGDDGILELSIADGVKIATWNNSLSDIGDNTLIDEGSPAWRSLATLEEGDLVHFSGSFADESENCVRESSIMDINGVLTPTFIFDFAGVMKA